MTQLSHAGNGWPSGSPTRKQWGEFLEQIGTGKIDKDNFQEFLKTAGRLPAGNSRKIISPEEIQACMGLEYDERRISYLQSSLKALLELSAHEHFAGIVAGPPHTLSLSNMVTHGAYGISQKIIDSMPALLGEHPLYVQEMVKPKWLCLKYGFAAYEGYSVQDEIRQMESFSRRDDGLRLPNAAEAVWIFTLLHRERLSGIQPPFFPYRIYTTSQTNVGFHLCVRAYPGGLCHLEQASDDDKLCDLKTVFIFDPEEM